jgi:hypothetical protein
MARGALAPLIEVLDRRLAQLTTRLEQHADALAGAQARRLDAIDERLAVNARVVDEHLLAIGRAARSINDAIETPVSSVVTIASGQLAVVSTGADLVPPSGYSIESVGAFTFRDGSWTVTDAHEGAATIRVGLLALAP